MEACNRHLREVSKSLMELVTERIEKKAHIPSHLRPVQTDFLSRHCAHDRPLFLGKDVMQVSSLSILRRLVEKEYRYGKNIDIVYKDLSAKEDDLAYSTAALTLITLSITVEPQATYATFAKSDFVATSKDSEVLLLATHGNVNETTALRASLSILGCSLKNPLEASTLRKCIQIPPSSCSKHACPEPVESPLVTIFLAFHTQSSRKVRPHLREDYAT